MSITVVSRRGEISLARAPTRARRAARSSSRSRSTRRRRTSSPTRRSIPFGKIAELKYCAVKVTKGGTLAPLATYGGGQSYSREPVAG
jgi:formate dehydrogenase major subunit